MKFEINGQLIIFFIKKQNNLFRGFKRNRHKWGEMPMNLTDNNSFLYNNDKKRIFLYR